MLTPEAQRRFRRHAQILDVTISYDRKPNRLPALLIGVVMGAGVVGILRLLAYFWGKIG